MVQVESITFEHHYNPPTADGYHVHPLGIGENCPSISWTLTGDEKDWKQASYELQIKRGDSGRTFNVLSSASILIPWPDKPLSSREKASVSVKVTGVDGSSSWWSNDYRVEAGLFDRKDWTSSVIAASRTLSTRGSLRPALFRKEFTISKKVDFARLYITAYGIYEAVINAKKIGDHVFAPGWTSYKYHLNYQTFDVTSLLRQGQNVIGAEVGEGWFSGRLGFNGGWRDIYGDKLAILAQLEVTFDDGAVMVVGSDKHWKTSVGPIISSQILDGEQYDVSQEVPGWSFPAFRDNDWSLVSELDFPTAKLQAPEGPPVRKVETVKAKSVFKTPAGKVVVDFGQNLVGWLRVHAPGSFGKTIIFTHTEVLEHGEIATRPLRDCRATDSLTLVNAPIIWEPKFTFHGFRYVQIDNWPSQNGEPGLEDIEAVVVHTDMKQTGWFECSEPMVNQLHSNIQWGMKGNFVSIPTDCPQRDERLGWTGDIQVFSSTANFLYDTYGMLSGWLKDLAIEQIKEQNGIVGMVVPNILPLSDVRPEAAWADAAVMTPWELYKSFGDTSVLNNQLESMQAWLKKGVDRQTNGLWNPYGHQFGDWLDPAAPPEDAGAGKTDNHLVANAYLVHVTDLVSQICGILKFKDHAEYYKAEAARLKKLFQYEYMTPNGRLAPDTMTSISLAIAFDLFASPSQIPAAAQRLQDIVYASNFKIATGFVGTPLILPSLTAVSKPQLAYRMLLERQCPNWLYPITMGATTMWERWDSMLPDGTINPGSMTSFNHYALGSVGAWLHATVGGISAAEPGWKVVRFAPVPGDGITWAKVRYLSMYGEVRCEWAINNGVFRMRIVVPLNCTGEVSRV